MPVDHNNNLRPDSYRPAGGAIAPRPFSEWVDRNARVVFITPAITLILIFAIFPMIASIVIALSRVRFTALGFKTRFVGLRNFKKLLSGNEQIHFLGRFNGMSVIGWIVMIVVIAAILYWMYRYFKSGATVVGTMGRIISIAVAILVTYVFAGTFLSGTPWGTLGTTLFFVLVGCGVQFVIGTGLAFLCAQPIVGRSFFRVVFFIPLMITPLGVGYAFRMMFDTTKGPLQPIWEWMGLIDYAWAANAWTARMFIVIGDSWQWIPFVFIVMLAALENVPREHVEAAQVDGAGSWQIFREITWPQIVPVAATVMLIRAIEAFKIVDLPNIMTAGGPGIATESLTLQALFAWRANDLGQSAAVAYLLLFLTVVTCASFFNYVVLRQIRKVAQ